MAINVKKNDTVVVLSGKDKGAKGVVTKVIADAKKVVVDGVNKVKRHEKPSQTNQTGGIVEKEMPIAISNVMVVDPKSGKPTRIKRAREAGKPSVRVSAKSGSQID
jgi:large subunit ribosomal protein L24